MKRNIWGRFPALILCLSLLSACRTAIPASSEPSAGVGREGGEFSTNGTLTVCVDAGHGFDDIGTSSSYLGGLNEKDITLDIVLTLRDCLEEKGIQVILTHDGTAFPKTLADDGNNLFNPQERISYADTLDIDYFVSIHCDSYEADEAVQGTRVYYSNGTKHTEMSAGAAKAIQDMVNEEFPDAKKCITKDMAKDNAYYVIREAKVPSALIEIGFVTNRQDAENMISEQWRDSFAAAVAEGIYAFFTE